jgi:hypothetical protein
MPNWCDNSVTFTHEDPLQIQRLIAAYNEGKLLNEFMPVPAELRETTSPMSADDSDEGSRLIEKYGFANWYDWCVNTWGTKWDIDNNGNGETLAEGATEVTISFQTAWSFPGGFYQHMVDELGFSVRAFYYEPGMSFCGLWEDGADDYYEIEGDSKWVEDHIPRTIDDCFAISGNMSQWEEEATAEEILAPFIAANTDTETE